jgi:hypothetical protein
MAERQVVFYECQDFPEMPGFDALAAVTGINQLDDDEWRIPDGDSHIAVIVDQPGSARNPIQLQLLRIRPDAPFRLTARRELTPIQVAENESITEFTWVMIWPDRYMAAISSRDAPGHKKLGTYFLSTSGQATQIVNLFRPDLPQRLRALRANGLRNAQLKIQTSFLQQRLIDENRTGFGQLLRAGRESEAATIGIELSVGRRGRDARLNDEIGAGMSYLADNVDLVESLHVKGRNDEGEIEEINLKQERIKAPIEIAYGTSNDDVYREIKRARREVEQEIGGLDRAARGN